MDSNVCIELYSTGWIPGEAENFPDADTAQSIADLFQRNYPDICPDEVRDADLARYKTGAQILGQIEDGNAWIVARIDDVIVGVQKFRHANRGGDELEILGSWVMTDVDHLRRGIGKLLFSSLEGFVEAIARDTSKSVSCIGDVLLANTASRALCRSMGYEEEPGKTPDFILARKRF